NDIAPSQRGGEHHRSRGRNIRHQRIEQWFQMHDIRNSYLEQEGFRTSDTVTFQNFRMRARNFHEMAQVLAANFDIDEGQDWQANFGWIDVSSIADDDSGLFHLVNTLGHRMSGESHDTAEFCERHTRILLQFA